MLISTLVYTLGCVVCASAPLMPILLAGRAVQGLGGGALVALVFVAQDRFFPNRLVPRIMACISVVWMTSALCGPLIGGAFATVGLWRVAFWAFAAQGLVLAVAVHPLLARAGPDVVVESRPIPGGRLALVAGAILLPSPPPVPWVRPPLASLLLVAGCLCLWLFAARDFVAAPRTRLLPRHATDWSHPVGCGFAMTFMLCLCMMAFVVYGPILLIRLYDLTPLEAGYVVVTESLGWTVGAFLLSGLAPAQEGRLFRIGSAVLLAGIAAQAWFVPHGPLWLVVVSAFLGHAGFGMMFGYIIKRVIANAAREDRGRAGSDAVEHPADRLCARGRAHRHHRARSRLRAPDAARGVQDGGDMAVCGVPAGGGSRQRDRVAIQRSAREDHGLALAETGSIVSVA